MTDEIAEALARIKRKYSITVNPGDGQIDIDVNCLNGDFRLSISEREHIIFTDSWHEHFDDYGGLETFLTKLFSGEIQFVVKCRGSTPVAHQLQVLCNGEIEVRSWTSSLVSPFWRKKSYRKLRYIALNKAINADQD